MKINTRLLLGLFIFLFSLCCKAENLLFTAINTSDGLSDNQVRYILQLPDGRMVFTTSGSLNLFDGQQFNYLHRSPQHIAELNQYDGHYRIYQEDDSLLWIKEMRKMMCIDLRKEQYKEEVADYLKQRTAVDGIGDLFVDGQSRIWLLSGDSLILNRREKIFDLTSEQGILQDLTADDSHLYLFYHTGKVVCYDLESGARQYDSYAFDTTETELFDKTSLVVSGKRGYYQLRNGRKGGFFFFDKERKAWERLLETDYVLNTLIVTPDEKAYISCANGIWTFDCESKALHYYPELRSVDGMVFDTEVSTIFQDAQKGLWLGTLNQGLLYYHPQRYKFAYIGRSYFPFTHKDLMVYALAEDANGTLFVSTSLGYFVYQTLPDGEQQVKPVMFGSLPTAIQKALTQRVHSPLELQDSRGWKWVGTQDGLMIQQGDEQPVRTYYTQDGLVNNSIRSLLEDREGNVWITTGYGISKAEIDGPSIRFVNFNPYDGTLRSEYIEGAALEAKDGILYFGGIDGFNVISPDRSEVAGAELIPVFTNLYLKGEQVVVDKAYDGRVLLNQSAPYTSNIELAHNQNFLTLEFGVPNYQNPLQTYYKYRLEGVDSDWRTLNGSVNGGKATISYTGLPSGDYRFQIMASDNYQWNSPARQLDIVVLTPWWRTRLAYVIYFLLLLSIVLLAFYLYQKQTRERLERKYKEEILLLRIKNLIEQCNLLETERESRQEKGEVIQNQSNEEESDKSLNAEESAFMARAIAMVEQNLGESGYSVEQLSRDLCMDRTGLYRKLMAVMDQTPTLFIRSIRLQKAAQLIKEGELSITEISDRLGFSTPSYMSRCFQDVYGCRPSEYAKRHE